MQNIRPSIRTTFAHAATLSLCALLPACALESEAPTLASASVASEQLVMQELPVPGHAGTETALAASKKAGKLTSSHASGDLFSRAQGQWVGTCDIIVPGQEEPTTSVGMELIVEPTEAQGVYDWIIVYHLPTYDQVRSYTMITDEETPGRYLLDENNGIVIPHYFFNVGILNGDYTVGNNRYLTRAKFKGNKLDFEIIVSAIEPELTSNLGSFVVDAFPVGSIQKCPLHRMGPLAP